MYLRQASTIACRQGGRIFSASPPALAKSCKSILCCKCGVRSMGYEEAQKGSEARTAFRMAEKKYKRYKEAGTSARRRRRDRHGSLGVAPVTDLADVLDFHEIAKSIGNDTDVVVHGARRLQGDYENPVFILADRPGFYFLPSALTPQQQQHLIQESLTAYLTPPNRTNHTASLGQIHGLWEAAQTDRARSCDKQESGTKMASRMEKSGTCQPHQDDTHHSDDRSSVEHLRAAEGSVKAVGEEDELEEDSPPVLREVDGSRTASLLESAKDGNDARGQRLATTSSRYPTNKANPLNNGDATNCHNKENTSDEGMVSAQTLLRKLRWATLGIQFDWSKRAYDPDLPFNPFPGDLTGLAAKLALPALGPLKRFNAQAAIVNFYGPDDMLGGHVDDMEIDWSKPIVSISLGCEAVFLLGGTTREEWPLAMYLRSGDVILMAGQARECYHAVPRIFTAEDGAAVPSHLQEETATPAFKPFAHYMRNSRINVNVREVD